METFDERSTKEKWVAFKSNASCKIKHTCKNVKENTVKTVTWVVNNPGTTVALIGTGVTVVKTVTGVVTKVGRVIEDQKNRTTVYCNDIQSDVRLKHELTYDEARKLRDFMNQGYTKFEALDEMNLLKK